MDAGGSLVESAEAHAAADVEPLRRVRRVARSADEVAARYPAVAAVLAGDLRTRERAWAALLTRNPDGMTDMLRDLIKHEANGGAVRRGQKPMPSEAEFAANPGQLSALAVLLGLSVP